MQVMRELWRKVTVKALYRLTEVLRDGSGTLNPAVVEVEVSEFLAATADLKTDDPAPARCAARASAELAAKQAERLHGRAAGKSRSTTAPSEGAAGGNDRL